MGTPVVGSRFDLLGGSDPGSVDHMFTPQRRQPVGTRNK
jgi:hypothetical protein